MSTPTAGVDADADPAAGSQPLSLAGAAVAAGVAGAQTAADGDPDRDQRWAEVLVVAAVVVCAASCLSFVGYCIYRRASRRAGRQQRQGDDGARLAERLQPAVPLPSYTLVTGLPSYDEALDQLQRRRELRRSSSAQRAIEMAVAAARAAGNLVAVTRLQAWRRLSVGDLIRYKFRSGSFDKG